MIREDWIKVPYQDVVNNVSTTNKRIKQRDYLESGKYPIIDQGKQLIGGYTDDESKLVDCSLPVIVFGDHTKTVKLINQKFAPGADGTKVLEPKGIVDPKYLAYFTQVLAFEIEDKGYARHYQFVEKEDLPIAPLSEQRAIVAKLEQLFSELDDGICSLRAAKEKLELYREAVLKKAFEGELTKKWRDQPGRLFKTGDFDEHDDNSQVEGLPKGWIWTRLGDVTEINPSLEGKSDIEPDLQVQFIPMKQVDEVINNIHLEEIRLFKDVQKRSYTYFAEGDVLFAKVTPCMENGKIAVARNLKNGIGYGSSEFHVFRCSSQISNQFLFYFLVQQCFRQDAMHAMTGAVGLRRVPKKYLEDYKIALPPILEQMQIIEEIENRLSVCDNIIVNIEKELEKSEALRQSILKKAFEGKLLTQEELDVCRREPDWEPAEKLLERIKKERNEQV